MIKIKKPCTVYIKFTGANPNSFNLYSSKHGLYYFRNLEGKTNRIKFNICHEGEYNSQTPFEVVKVVPIEIPGTLPGFPKYERDEIKDFVITDNLDLTGSPARIFASKGIIERGREFYKLPKPVRVFILLHEIGHFFYGINNGDIKKAESLNAFESKDFLRKKMFNSESKCDLFAMIHFLQMGYNRSTAYYSLNKILSRSQENINRVKNLISNIQKTQNNELT